MKVPATIELPGEDFADSHRRDMSRLTGAAGVVFLLALSPSLAWFAFAPSATAVAVPGVMTVDARHLPRPHAEGVQVAEERVSDEREILAARHDAPAERLALLHAERDRIAQALRNVGARIVEAKRSLARHREEFATHRSRVVTASVGGTWMDPGFPAPAGAIAAREASRR